MIKQSISGYSLNTGESAQVILNTEPEKLAIKPSETALIVVDMQNAYASKEGYLDLAGFDVSGTGSVIENINKAIDVSRKAGIQIVFLQTGISRML
jgi:ureidoacrylate peracid hydrolase